MNYQEKVVLTRVITVAIVCLCLGGFLGYRLKPTIVKEKTEVVTVEPTYFYPMCDIFTMDMEQGVIDVIMQNGEIETFTAYDLPERADIITFRCTDLDDYNTYEIIGIY